MSIHTMIMMILSTSKLFLARFFQTLLYFMNNAKIYNSAQTSTAVTQDRTKYKSFKQQK